MRDFLTGLAIMLIIVLTTILVAPYFVDWNAQRDFLEARLSHALGQKVTVGGTIDLKLLPTPYLILDQVVVGGDEAPVKIGVRHLNLELAISPLLHGEFDIVEAQLREPTMRVTMEPGNTLPVMPAAPAFSADVRFERIRVEDGTLAIANPDSGRTFVVEHLDVDADAGSFYGPFKIVGAGGPPDSRTSFRLATGAAKNGQVHARLSIDENSVHPGVDFDGALDLRTSAGKVAEKLDGKLVLSGRVRRQDKDPIPWRFAGPFQADPKQAQSEGGELRVGGEDASLTLQADARAYFAETARLWLDLKAKQLDIDRLSGVPATGAPVPPQLPDLTELRSMLAAQMPLIPTDLNIAVDAATYGGETLSAIALRTTLGDAASHPIKLAIDGPGGSRVAADGTLAAGTEPSFSGTLDLKAENLPRAMEWARGIAPAFSWTGEDTRLGRVKLRGPVEWTARAIASPHLAVTLDRTKLDGTVRLAFGATRPALVADLKSEALDLERLPGLDRLLDGSNGIDLDLRLDAKVVKVEHAGDGTLDAGRVRLDVGKNGDDIALHALKLDDLGGANVTGSGHLGPGGGQLKMTLDAGHLEAAAELLRQLLPGVIADAIVARASALAPAKLDLDASLHRRGGTFVPSQLAIHGSLAQTKVETSATPEADNSDATTLSLSLQSPDGAALLQQLGLNTVPIQTIGASHVTVSAHGRRGDLLDTKLEASFGGSKFDATGRFDLLTVKPHGSGDVQLKSTDLAPLLQTLAIAFPDMTRLVPADAKGQLAIADGNVDVSEVTGRVAGVETRGSLRWRRTDDEQPPLTGTLEIDRIALSSLVGLSLGHEQATPADAVWSRQPFAVGLIDPPRAAFAVKTKVLDLLPGVQAKNASLDLGIAPNTVTIDNLKAELSGGSVTSRAKLRRDGRQVTIDGNVALDRVRVQIPSTLDAGVDAKVDFSGGGASAFALMSSLAGSGEATSRELRVTGADPKALVRIFDDVEADVLAVDQDAVVRAYNEMPRGVLSVGTIQFGLRLAAGVLHFDPKSKGEASQPASSRIDGSLDLPQGRLAAHVEETLEALPKNWSGTPPAIEITLDGPLGRPQRSVDVGNFLNAVAARALTRESSRIEAYELDVRERAFFNARLQSERRREEERQKGEDDARKAEAERKARLEAARQEKDHQEKDRKEQERQHQEQAAKAAREADEKAARERAGQGAREPVRREGEKPQDDPNGPPPQKPAAGESRDPSALGRY